MHECVLNLAQCTVKKICMKIFSIFDFGFLAVFVISFQSEFIAAIYIINCFSYFSAEVRRMVRIRPTRIYIFDLEGMMFFS